MAGDNRWINKQSYLCFYPSLSYCECVKVGVLFDYGNTKSGTKVHNLEKCICAGFLCEGSPTNRAVEDGPQKTNFKWTVALAKSSGIYSNCLVGLISSQQRVKIRLLFHNNIKIDFHLCLELGARTILDRGGIPSSFHWISSTTSATYRDTHIIKNFIYSSLLFCKMLMNPLLLFDAEGWRIVSQASERDWPLVEF